MDNTIVNLNLANNLHISRIVKNEEKLSQYLPRQEELNTRKAK